MDFWEQAYDQIGRACGPKTIGRALVGPTPWSQQSLDDRETCQQGRSWGQSWLPG